jgi:endonuclease/exonuclease/phosphatase (EEP) superfamily protein YafD
MSKSRTRFRPVGGRLSALLLLALFLSAVAPLVEADRLSIAMLLTYPPRMLLLMLCLALAVFYLLRRRWAGAMLSVGIALMVAANLEWGAGAEMPAEQAGDEFRLLAFNVHDRIDRAPELADFARRRGLDFLVLQEVKPDSFIDFESALSDYRLYTGDRSKRFEHDDWGPFSSVIGVHRRFQGRVVVDTAITGYRTFAASIELDGVRLQLVNVHTTKAFWTGGAWYEPLTRMGYKARWHRGEIERLNAWIARHSKEPIIAAGDFNAPHGAVGTRLPALRSAHAVSGSALNLSFPRKLPIWDIDHSLGNDRVEFLGYTSEDMGYSDHRAQFVRFRINPG